MLLNLQYGFEALQVIVHRPSEAREGCPRLT